jgi:DNA-binding CsgD family transcriptional regulator
MREGVPESVFRKTPFYQSVAKDLGIVDQLVMHVFIKSGRGVVLTYHFPDIANQTQHLKASILRGHLVARLYAIDLAIEKQRELALDIGEHLRKRITQRELTIMRSICQGLGNQEIATQLGISKRTTDHHVSSLLRKLSATNRFQLISRFGNWIEMT